MALWRIRALFTLSLFAAPIPIACRGDGATPRPAPDRGSLIRTSMDAQVGVLLDEIPEAMRDRAAAAILAEPTSFWKARAAAQVKLVVYRLIYRKLFYKGKGQLPIPPQEAWSIAVDPAGPRRIRIGAHDLVAVGYRYAATLLSDAASPGEAEPALAKVGGAWDEPYILPADPELLFQRTGYACMNEREFPPNSVDGESTATFYDDHCKVAPPACHLTPPLPLEDCVDALDAHVGRVEARLHYARVPWNEAEADKARVGPVTHEDGADIAVMGAGLENHRIIYRYIPPDSCSIVEGCVGGTGWRRLLQFDASVKNLGAKALDIGDVDYYITGKGTALDQHHIYEYSPCHHHYHFSHYGKFLFGSGAGQSGEKKAFCLQSTARYSNNESSPLVSPYGTCSYQGISPGWGDDYGAGLECQWIDVTAVDTSHGPVTAPLSFVVNPDQFLCEGTPVLDADGHPTFEPTHFKTAMGDTVDRPVCRFVDDWQVNNADARPATLPETGGFTTAPCARGQIGPLRDCGFTEQRDQASILACAPGAPVTLHCSLADPTAPQVLRVCERSAKLGAGVSCTYRDALANRIITDPVDVPIPCPSARDAEEPGGALSLYAAPLLPDSPAQPIRCAVAP